MTDTLTPELERECMRSPRITLSRRDFFLLLMERDALACELEEARREAEQVGRRP